MRPARRFLVRPCFTIVDLGAKKRIDGNPKNGWWERRDSRRGDTARMNPGRHWFGTSLEQKRNRDGRKQCN
jgi:hypothetical protein